MPEHEFKSMSKKELCNYFNISYSLLRKWLEPIKNIGDYKGKYTPKQVNLIFKHLVVVE